MKRDTFFLVISLALLAALLALPGNEAVAPSARKNLTRAPRLPVSFEANHGQAQADIDFLSRNKGYTIALNATEARLSLMQPHAPVLESKANAGAKTTVIKTARADFSFKLVGANGAAQGKGLEELPGKISYLTGNDPRAWREHIPTFAKVRYNEIYPGIDLIYYSSSHSAGRLEYDFIVQPNAEVDVVKMNFTGVEALALDDRGDLVMRTPSNPQEIRFHKPVVYQEVQGERREIAANYKIEAKHLVGFEVGEYDASRELVIDPVLSYSTYLGGGGDDLGVAIDVDASGNIYLAGYTYSNNFPGTNPANFHRGVCGVEPDTFATADVFIAKLSADGSTLVYATYLGGAGNDFGHSLAVDASGNVVVAGITNSTDFPVMSAFQSTFGGGSGECLSGDAFIAKLNANGTALVYSTYLGGSNDDLASSVALDAASNVYLTGWTQSSDWETTSNALQDTLGGVFGARDAFIAKLNPTGSALVFSTFLGGSETDEASAIALDAANNVYVTGKTLSPDFPRMNPRQSELNGQQDAFIAKLEATGSALVYSTYHGGGGDESGTGIGVDASGNAYVTGVTSSTDDFPTMSARQPNFGGGEKDAFVSKFNPTGDTLLYSTYHGGAEDDFSTALAVDAAGNACVWGFTSSNDFPVENAVQGTLRGGTGDTDAFLSTLNAAGDTLLSSTYLGGTDSDQGFGLALDNSGNTYVVGLTSSTNFPMGTSTPYQSNPRGNVETFAGKITGALPTAVRGREEGMPLSFMLAQNYPNPFNPTTAIRFHLTGMSEIEVAIYSTAGQLVRQLARGKYVDGEHTVVWDGKNEAGMRVASGVYVYKLKAGEFVAQRKLVLMK